MKIYLAGPMRGLPELNFPAFHKAAKILRAAGHDVFNPADNGPDMEIRDAMHDDLAWICKEADAVALLPGWINSKGAKAERATADALGLRVIYIPDEWDWSLCEVEAPKADGDEDAKPLPSFAEMRRKAGY